MKQDDAQNAELLQLLGVDNMNDAIERVRMLVSASPVLAIDANGTLTLVKGMTVGGALRMLATAQARIENTVIAS